LKKINIGIVAHVDAGKTTITENLLYHSGVIKEIGRVDNGNTQTDSMEIERKRGISIKSSPISFTWNDFKINIIESILKISIIYFLIPIYGFNAYIFALFVTTLLNTILYLIRLLQVSCIIFDISNWIFKPVIAAIISSIVSRILFILFLSNTSSEMFVLISSIIILCFLYLIFLILLKSINTTTMKNVKTLVKH